MRDEIDEAVALANGRSVPPSSAAPGRPRAGNRPPPGTPGTRSAHGEDDLDTPAWILAPPSSPAGASGTDHPAAPAVDHEDSPSWSTARALAGGAAGSLEPAALPLAEALHHTLAEPLEALTDLPPFDTSAMDGWAVAGPGPWAAPAGDGPGILAGDRGEPDPLEDGRAVRIATGARVPPGTGAVLRREDAETSGGRVRSAHPPVPGADIRLRGQECRTGDELLPAGIRVTPAVLGLAAAAGYDRLAVVRRPRAEVLVLGDELLRQGLPGDGRIRDALGPMTGPWLEALGADVLVTRHLGDDAEALHEAVATTTADLVVTTGGTAAGPVDHVHPTLEALGADFLVDGVRVRPGHPMLLARLPGGAHLVGLPGNPLAALAGLVTLAAPLLGSLAGRAPEPELRVRADVQGTWPRSHLRDTRLVPVTCAAGRRPARPLRWTGPAMLRGIAAADALAVLPPGTAPSGGDVRVLTLPW